MASLLGKALGAGANVVRRLYHAREISAVKRAVQEACPGAEIKHVPIEKYAGGLDTKYVPPTKYAGGLDAKFVPVEGVHYKTVPPVAPRPVQVVREADLPLPHDERAYDLFQYSIKA